MLECSQCCEGATVRVRACDTTRSVDHTRIGPPPTKVRFNMHFCLFVPGPPNLGLSKQKVQRPQSSMATPGAAPLTLLPTASDTRTE